MSAELDNSVQAVRSVFIVWMFRNRGEFFMDYGSSILARRPLANRDGVDAMAKCGEKHGLA